MLVLTRKLGQQVFIGSGMIQVKILKIEGGNITLGVNAPDHIDVDREEIFFKKIASRNTDLMTEVLA